MEKYALILSALIGTLILIVSLACYKVSQDPSLKHGDFMHLIHLGITRTSFGYIMVLRNPHSPN